MKQGIGVMLVVEDALSEAVMRRVLRCSPRPFSVERVQVTGGVGAIRQRVPVFLNACRVVPHVVLADLDAGECAARLLSDWKLSRLPAELLIRIAVRAVEAWLLADAHGLADFLQVPSTKIPDQPEVLADPKQTLINIARRSRSRRLAAEIVPPPGSRARTGPLYNQKLGYFASERWNVGWAAQQASSLARALAALERFLDEPPRN